MILAALWGVWGVINAIVFMLYGMDKRSAVRGKARIPERTLLLCTWLFGGVGALLAMRVFHHKTAHRAFRISVPIAAAASLGVMGAMSVYWIS